MDYASGQVLAAQEPDLKLEPASLTKVMTTYLVAEALQQKRSVAATAGDGVRARLAHPGLAQLRPGEQGSARSTPCSRAW
jgi:D-alanyl-D-alanine carboxypeptidase